MRKARPLFRHRLVLRAALVTSLVLVAPVRAQDGAKIEIVPLLGHSNIRSVGAGISRGHPLEIGWTSAPDLS
jgi:hypothetical protein